MKSLLLLMGLYAFSANSQTPNYFENSPSWSSSYATSDPGTETITKYVYFIDGTETIGDYTYFLMYERSQTSLVYAEPDEPTPETHTNAGMRVRQEGRSIYYYTSEGDSLFINYDLEVGDSFTGAFGNANPSQTVGSIDSVLVGDEYRWILSNETGDSKVIEGIGHYGVGQGYFGNTFFAQEGIGFYYQLYCYGENAISLWSNPDSEGCFLSLSIDENENSLINNLSIYPVPARNVITVSAQEELSSIAILSLSGDKILEVNSNLENIDLSKLPSGIYLIQIVAESGTIEQRRIVKY